MEALLETPKDSSINELPLPSDTNYEERIELLQSRICSLEKCNEALRLRIEETLSDWQDVQCKLHENEISDILCDFIADFYHSDLLAYMRSNHEKLKLPFKPETWNEISMKLCEEAKSKQHDLRDACMKCADLTADEWDALYDFKRSRNVRVHPKRNKTVIRRVLRELPTGTLRTALTKMFKKMLR